MMPSRPERQSLRAPLRDATLRRSYLIRVFGLIWTAARGWTVAWGILLVVQGLMPVALVYLTKPLVDGLQAAVGRGTSWETVRPVLLVVVGIGGVLLLTELLKVCLEWIGTAQSELVQDHITDLVHAKSTAVDLAFMKRPTFTTTSTGLAAMPAIALWRCSKAAVGWCKTASPWWPWRPCCSLTAPGSPQRCCSVPFPRFSWLSAPAGATTIGGSA